MNKIIKTQNSSIFINNVKKIEIVCNPYNTWKELYEVIIVLGDNYFHERVEIIGKYSSKAKAVKVYDDVLKFITVSNMEIFKVFSEEDICDNTIVKIKPFNINWCEEEILDILSVLCEDDLISEKEFQNFLENLANKKFDNCREAIKKWENRQTHICSREKIDEIMIDIWGRIETLKKDLQ